MTIEGVLIDALKKCEVIGADITIDNLQQVSNEREEKHRKTR